MLVLLYRTAISYLLLLATLKLMGKRQIGELRVSELVSALLLSEIAAAAIEDTEASFIELIIPLATILALELLLSLAATKVDFLKQLLDGRPDTLIYKGKLNIDALSRARISAEELVSEIRQHGIADIAEVQYAILEQNGKLSVIPKAPFSGLTPDDINIDIPEKGITHLIVVDGRIKANNFTAAGIDDIWLSRELARRGMKLEDVFLLTVNDLSEVNIVLKEKK